MNVLKVLVRSMQRWIANKPFFLCWLFFLNFFGGVIPLTKELGRLYAASSSDKMEGDYLSDKEGYMINFNNVSIIEYIRFVSKIRNINFVFDSQDLDFKVTIVSEEPTSVKNI
ncbi:MAG: hypothetical protein ACM3JI_02805, partial [Anaerolineae bacterium]